MSTKDNCLSHKKDKQNSFDLGGNGCSSFNNSQYSNFNLNQTLKCQEIRVLTSQNGFASASFYSNDKEINGLSRIAASSNILSDYPRNGSNFLNCNNTKRFWKMSDEERKKPFFDPFEDNLKHFKKKESDTFTRSKSKNAKNDSGSTKNKSTLSLHIAAYENAFEAAESGTIENLNTKMPKQNPGVMRYLPKAAAANYNLIEVPRQQEDDTRGSKDPEIMQFKASQKLLNPNDPKFQVPTTNRNGDNHQQSQQPLHQPPPQHYQHQGGPHQIIPHPHQHLYRQHQQQQQQQQQFYGYPQQSYYHPNAANYRASMPQLLQHPQPGTLLAVNEHGQPLGYVFPQHPQWNSVPQQYTAASQLRGTRPSAAAAPATEYWQQQQRPPMVMMPSTALPSQRHQQLNPALPPQQFQGRMGSPQFYYPQPIRFPYSNQPGPSTAMPTPSQTSDYWQQRPTSMMTMMQPQPLPAPSHRRTSSSAGFIPVQPRSSPVAKRRYRPPSPGLNTTAGTLNPQFQPQPSHSPIFPADSIEASAAKFLGPQKSTKKFAKDFKYQPQNNMSSLLEFVKETKGSAAVVPAAKEPEVKLPKPTEEDISKICRDVWLTLISSSHPQTSEAIENHFRIDNGYRLNKVSASLGFHSTEAFLCSDIISHIIHPSIIKDELDEYGVQRFSAVSFHDITHITDLMSESALTEEEKEARKEYFRNAKYSKMEYQEKAIEMRQKLACLAHEFMEANSTDTVSWDKIQEAYLKKFGQQLNKKHLREAFPTGHPSRIVEVYMNDEFMLGHHPTMTGNLLLKFRRPYSEILQLFEEAKNAVKTQQSVIKPLEYRTKDNVYVDYVRERQKKEVFLQRKASRNSANEDFSNSSSPKNNSLQSTNKFENVGILKMKESEKLGNFNAKESSQNVVKPIEPYARDDPFVEKESEPNYRLPNPRIIVPRKARIDWEKC